MTSFDLPETPPRDAPRFEQLSREGQLFLAAWAVLLKSEPQPRLTDLPAPLYCRAVGDIAATVGLRVRKRCNHALIRANRKGMRFHG